MQLKKSQDKNIQIRKKIGSVILTKVVKQSNTFYRLRISRNFMLVNSFIPIPPIKKPSFQPVPQTASPNSPSGIPEIEPLQPHRAGNNKFILKFRK